jgi:pectate lyase
MLTFTQAICCLPVFLFKEITMDKLMNKLISAVVSLSLTLGICFSANFMPVSAMSANNFYGNNANALVPNVQKAETPLPAFPGAEGFGSQTMGGRGGQIIEVTNLNDSGAGSFRAAVSALGARIIVFKVSGIIQASSVIHINNPYITIAGQTAPGGGIAVKGSGISIRTHDVIIRGMKMIVLNAGLLH